jgi:hypothetical protein
MILEFMGLKTGFIELKFGALIKIFTNLSGQPTKVFNPEQKPNPDLK